MMDTDYTVEELDGDVYIDRKNIKHKGVFVRDACTNWMEYIEENYMCHKNADDVLDIATTLRLIADDIQDWYYKWKHRDFKK